MLALKDVCQRLANLGEAADTFARKQGHYPLVGKQGQGLSLYTPARDLATHIAIAMQSLSPAAIEAINA
jgi:hypothetical protein